MKVLYAFQGTGNGHLSRANEILPKLKNLVETDVLVSGNETELFPCFKIDFHLKGLGFYFGAKGGINFIKSISDAKVLRLVKDIFTFPVQDYDLVINDFEPITAWSCKLKNVKCISISHQSALWSKNAPKPESRSLLGEIILRYYAPTSLRLGFHFRPYDKFIVDPIIKNSIKNVTVKDEGHYTIYLPSYNDNIILEVLNSLPKLQCHIFSKRAVEIKVGANYKIIPIDELLFSQSMASARGIICGAGFETPAEALYLGKKLLVVPMKAQYEQQCNAAALKELGVTVIKKFDQSYSAVIRNWILTEAPISRHFFNSTQLVLDKVDSILKTIETPILRGPVTA